MAKVVYMDSCLQPMEVGGGSRYPPAPHGGTCTGAGGFSKEDVTPWEGCAGAGFWQHLVEEPILEQSAPEGLCSMEETHIGVVHEELQPVGRTQIGEIHGELPHMGKALCWNKQTV